MDSFDHDPSESTSSSATIDDEKLEYVHELLEEGWFFGEVLTSKPRMLRCYSDPSPNFNYTQKSFYSSKKDSSTLIRAPSLPTRLETGEEAFEEKERKGMSKLMRQLSDHILFQEPNNIQEKESHNYRKNKMISGKSSKKKLLRTPSLPPYIGREEVNEEIDESDTSMSRLIRQAMPISTEVLPPRHTSKGTMQNYKPPRNLKNINQKVIEKSQSGLESQNVQGFTFNKQVLDPSAVGILYDLQEKKKQNQDQKVKRPYRTDSWHVQSCAPPIPLWGTKNSAEDMKVQLKCWARAVASNVR